jgi:hypothetical protein
MAHQRHRHPAGNSTPRQVRPECVPQRMENHLAPKAVLRRYAGHDQITAEVLATWNSFKDQIGQLPVIDPVAMRVLAPGFVTMGKLIAGT